MKLSYIYASLLTLNLVGFPLIAGVTTYFNVNSTNYSILMRAIILGMSILLVMLTQVSNRIKFVHGIFWMPLLFFWFAYVLRIYFDTILEPITLSKEVIIYWIWAVGACIVPMLGLLTYPKDNYFNSAYKLSFLLLVLSSILVSFLGSGIYTPEHGAAYESGRLRIESLNPISVGHLGLSLLLLSIWPFFRGDKQSPVHIQVIYIISSLLGIYLLVASASRGPIVAFVLVLFFYFISEDLKRNWKVLAVTAILILSIVQLGNYLEDTGSYQFLSRIENVLNSKDIAVSGRELSYEGAVDQFIRNPIFGDALEEKKTRTYPHNVILESFMATGVIGGIPFIFLILYGVFISYKLIKLKTEHGWIPMIFIQYLLAAQFSGGIYTVSTMWTFFAILIVLYSTKKDEIIKSKRSIYQLIQSNVQNIKLNK